ncbi:hypothetical protein BLOT_015852 [Blomia tropicalis]|nr:hypothetical protein BLOT_016685 [Blomia tropicalis]KAI2796298.1 hypothetical protein BLOT_015852 [Blomia tropicalis]
MKPIYKSRLFIKSLLSISLLHCCCVVVINERNVNLSILFINLIVNLPLFVEDDDDGDDDD